MSTATEASAPPTAPRAAVVRHRFFSPPRVWALATNTLTELVRLKVFYFLLIFAFLLIGYSLFQVRFTFQGQFQMLKDVSLGAMSIFTSLLAILATANLLPKDIEDRTLYTILAKPVPRFEYLTGKLLGVFLLLLISIALMGVMFAVVLWWRVHVVSQDILAGATASGVANQELAELHASAYDPALWTGGVVIYAQACLLAALTLFISTFASSYLFTVIVAVAVYLIGHLQGTARDYLQATGSLEAHGTLNNLLLKPLVLIFPDLQAFNLVDEIVAGVHIAPALVAKTLGLGLSYVLVYLFAGYFMFAQREI